MGNSSSTAKFKKLPELDEEKTQDETIVPAVSKVVTTQPSSPDTRQTRPLPPLPCAPTQVHQPSPRSQPPHSELPVVMADARIAQWVAMAALQTERDILEAAAAAAANNNSSVNGVNGDTRRSTNGVQGTPPKPPARRSMGPRGMRDSGPQYRRFGMNSPAAETAAAAAESGHIADDEKSPAPKGTENKTQQRSSRKEKDRVPATPGLRSRNGVIEYQNLNKRNNASFEETHFKAVTTEMGDEVVSLIL